MSDTQTSLSKYFPDKTVYYYGYPSGQDSKFYNQCPPSVEELVAMRPTVCAGSGVKVVCLGSTIREDILRLLRDEIGQPVTSEDRMVILPKEIGIDLDANERNKRIKNALKLQISPGELVMAQPYIDKELTNLYQIDPNLTIYLNDKKNIPDLAPEANIIPQYGSYANGAEFSNMETEKCPLPCVIKVSSSSAGDGVRICKKTEDIEKAKFDFRTIEGNIIVQKYIKQAKDIAVDFAIPHDPNSPMEIIGLSEQITGENGDYLGGSFCKKDENKSVIRKIHKTILEKILPKMQKMGWYGVGAIDVLVDNNEDFYFIDFNCRMAATTPYSMQIKNEVVTPSLITFTGTFKGTEADFKRDITKIARIGDPSQKIHIITLTEREGIYRLNAGVLFDQPESIKANSEELMRRGIRAEVLKVISSSHFVP